MTSFPMFPLGSVLFPHMPLVLRVFEERYLVMLSRILQDEPSEFGVTLIERGQEVGGGEQRFAIGTVAQITQLDAAEGFVVLVAEGERRIAIDNWLEEDPHPQADIRVLPDLVWDESLRDLRDSTEATVRRVLSVASEFTDQTWSAAVELADEPIAAIWQLAAIAPLGPLDQVELLGSTTAEQLLTKIAELTLSAEEFFVLQWNDEVDDASGNDVDDYNDDGFDEGRDDRSDR